MLSDGLRRLLGRLVQSVGRTSAGALVGPGMYRAAASAAARWLGEIPGVEGVYLTGSLTRPSALQPGYSDIDLVLVAELPTLDAELRFRNELFARQAKLNALGDLFKNIDYIEPRDFGFVRGYAEDWALDMDRRWICLDGVSRLGQAVPLFGEYRRRERLRSVLRRWIQASSYLLDPHAARPEFIEGRGARRMLADALTAYFDVDPLEPLSDLLARARDRVEGATVLAEIAGRARRTRVDSVDATVDRLLAASLEVLELLANELAGDWSTRDSVSTWPVVEPAVVGREEETVAARALAHGFGSVSVVSQLGGDQLMLVVAPSSDSASEAVGRLRELQRDRVRLPESRFAWVERPVLVTAPLVRVAALFEPAPFVGANLIARVDHSWGACLAAPIMPSGVELEHLLRCRATRLFTRPRGRRFRRMKGARSVHDAMARDIVCLAPALDALRTGNVAPAPSGSTSELELLRTLRDWMAEARPWLASPEAPAPAPE